MKRIGLLIAGIIAVIVAFYFLVVKKTPTTATSSENGIVPGIPSPTINHNVVGEIPANPTQSYMGEQVTPIVTVQQGITTKQIPLNELPDGSYIDPHQIIHVPVTDTSQTVIVANPSLGTVNVGLAGSNGTPYSSDSLTLKGIPNDFSWVSPELRATGIDPAILHMAPYPGVANSWIITTGADGRAYAREEHGYMDAVFVATPKGWELFSGTVPQDTPIGAYGDVKTSGYGNIYSQEYWNKYGGQILAGAFD